MRPTTIVAAPIGASSPPRRRMPRSSVPPPCIRWTTPCRSRGYRGKTIGDKAGSKHRIKVLGQSARGSEKDTIERTEIGAPNPRLLREAQGVRGSYILSR